MRWNIIKESESFIVFVSILIIYPYILILVSNNVLDSYPRRKFTNVNGENSTLTRHTLDVSVM